MRPWETMHERVSLDDLAEDSLSAGYHTGWKAYGVRNTCRGAVM